MNATINTKDNTLVITLPLQKATVSKTGKSQIVASSGGFKPMTVQIEGKPVKVNVTAII